MPDTKTKKAGSGAPLRLGFTDRELEVEVFQGGEAHILTLVYRDREVSEWSEFNRAHTKIIADAQVAGAVIDRENLTAEDKARAVVLGEEVSELYAWWGARVLVDARGVETPPDIKAADAIMQYCPEALVALGQHVFTPGAREAAEAFEQAGKSEGPPESS